MIQVMLDLETMGAGNHAAIVAIGAVKFDPSKPEMGYSHFYTRVGLESSVGAGMVMDPSTVLWWLEQSEEARKGTFSGETATLRDALASFSIWVDGNRPVWGNGATFDNVIIRAAYAAVGLTPPWKYWNDRCYRTMKSLVTFKAERVGVAHNALDDAISQARHLQQIYSYLGLSC